MKMLLTALLALSGSFASATTLSIECTPADSAAAHTISNVSVHFDDAAAIKTYSLKFTDGTVINRELGYFAAGDNVYFKDAMLEAGYSDASSAPNKTLSVLVAFPGEVAADTYVANVFFQSPTVQQAQEKVLCVIQGN